MWQDCILPSPLSVLPVFPYSFLSPHGCKMATTAPDIEYTFKWGGEREEKGENISFVCPFYQKLKSFPEAPPPSRLPLYFIARMKYI